jgi:D-inositol-3-phosphate glycosyltransferase
MMEGWGITTIEASACATPVVASDVPGLRDSVQNPHTGFLVEHGEAALFAEKIIVLLEDEDLRKRIGVNGYLWAQNFDWNMTSKKFLEAVTGESGGELILENIYERD